VANGFVPGIDVSTHQGHVNWSAVSKAGISFAFARATIGGQQTDAQFAVNWTGIRTAGLRRGAYHYFWPATPWQDQAANFINTVGKLQSGDLPPALDLEEAFLKGTKKHDAWKDVPPDQRLPMIQNWLGAVETALGLQPIIYTRQNFIEPLLGDGIQRLSNSPLWIAHYGVLQPQFPSAWATWTFWQNSEKGNVSGVNGNVDLDNFNGSPDDLAALAKQ
jgi:lysozyme